MSQLLRFFGKNYTPYEEFEFAFTPGIHLVLGCNLDANPGSTNAAGKSTLFGAVSELFFDEPVNAIKEKKVKSKLDTHLGAIYTGVDGKTYEAVRYSGKHSKIDLKCDGKDLKNRGIDYSLGRMQQTFGLNEEEFFSLAYLSSQRRHPLIVGKSVERQKYFVNLYRLNESDAARKALLLQYREVQKAVVVYREITTQYTELKERFIGTEKLAELKTELETLKVKQKTLLKTINRLKRVNELTSFESDNADLLQQFKTHTSIDSFKSDKKKCDAKLEALEAQFEVACEWKAYRSAIGIYQEKAKPIKEKLAKFNLTQNEARKNLKRLNRLRVEIEVLTSSIEELDKLEPVDEPKYNQETSDRKIAGLKEELEHTRSFDGGKCPTCGQNVDVARPVEEIEEEIRKWTRRRKEALTYSRYQESYQAYKKGSIKNKETESKIAELRRGLESVREAEEQVALYEQLPDRPQKPDTEEVEYLDTKRELNRIKKLSYFFESVEHQVEMIRELYEVTDEQRKEMKDYDLIGERLEKLNSRISATQTQIIRAEDVATQLKQLRIRGKQLKKQVEDEPVLKALLKIHRSNGVLQKMKMQAIAELIQANLNKYRKIPFSEDFTFEINIGTQFEILVHRHYGKEVKTSDVRKLSGAESMLFSLLMLISSLPLVPAKRRPNFLILDEPTAAMGPDALEAFARMLPMLNKIIPCIVILTPKSGERYEGAFIHTAVKKNGVSKLISGVPKEMLI